MTNKNEMPLKNCPFCGGNPDIQNIIAPDLNYYEVACNNCRVTVSSEEDTAEEAILIWNTRAAQPQQPVDLDALKSELEYNCEEWDWDATWVIKIIEKHLASRGMIGDRQCKSLSQELHDENTLLSCKMMDHSIRGETFTMEEAQALHEQREQLISVDKQPTEDAQRALDALDRLKNHSTPYGEFEDGVTQWQYDIETIRAALARGLGE